MAVKRSSSSAEERWSSEQEQGDPNPAAELAEDQLFCSCETSQENHWTSQHDPNDPASPAAELAELFCSCKAVREQGDGGRSQLVVGLLGWRLPEPRNSVQEQGYPTAGMTIFASFSAWRNV